MPLFWFIAGIVTTLACLVAILPWLRTNPRFSALSGVSKPVAYGGALALAAILGLYIWLGRTAAEPQFTKPVAAGNATDDAAGSFASAAKLIDEATSASPNTANTVPDTANRVAPAGVKSGASSMDIAVANLESRLAKGGGTAGDWELLAKSYEFMGRAADAATARARRLPANDTQGPGVAAPGAPRSGTTVSGEISLALTFDNKISPGETLFIVAKSVGSPGIPVAVIRTSVGHWPLKFTLDDSQSMMPGRNLSGAGRITIEARISPTGQAMPVAGDLQGSTGVINPQDHQPLKIMIDRVIT
jgi:cytochrome c-type biogenesis protein CcmH